MDSAPQTKSDRFLQREAFVLPALILITSAVLFLIAHYLLGSWSEASESHHTIQHLLIFLAGMGVGASGLRLAKNSN